MLRVTTFIGFMSSVMIFTNVWFDGLLSDVLLPKPGGSRLQYVAAERTS